MIKKLRNKWQDEFINEQNQCLKTGVKTKKYI